MQRRDLERRLLACGWILLRHGAKHDVWKLADREIAVPRHTEINEFTARAILKQAEERQQ